MWIGRERRGLLGQPPIPCSKQVAPFHRLSLVHRDEVEHRCRSGDWVRARYGFDIWRARDERPAPCQEWQRFGVEFVRLLHPPTVSLNTAPTFSALRQRVSRCDNESRSFQTECTLALAQGVTMEDDMVADVTDAALWFLLAGMIGFIACGCRYTRLAASRYRSRRDG
jgi:hypothetical protein